MRQFLLVSCFLTLIVGGLIMQPPPHTFAERTRGLDEVQFVFHIDGDTSAVAVIDDYAFIGIRWDSHVWNIANPFHPIKGAEFEGGHGAHAIIINDNKLYAKGAGITILNVTNPAAPSHLGYHSGPTSARDMILYDSGDKQYAYLVDTNVSATSFLTIVDVSNPAETEQVERYEVEEAFFGSLAKVENWNYTWPHCQDHETTKIR
jgi:hypothetical protein